MPRCSFVFKASDVLMQVKIPVKTESDCSAAYVENEQFCAGDTVTIKDSCEVSWTLEDTCKDRKLFSFNFY